MYGRFFSKRDLKFVGGVNAELLNDIVQTEVTLFKLCATSTQTNIYGESDQKQAKQFYPGIDITVWIDRAEIATDVNDFGPNRKQNVAFKFSEAMLKEVNFYPQTGDLVFFNDRYHEIDNVVQEQLIGGQPEKSWSIIVNTHYSRLSKIDIVERQS